MHILVQNTKKYVRKDDLVVKNIKNAPKTAKKSILNNRKSIVNIDKYKFIW